jgi:gluconate kinase
MVASQFADLEVPEDELRVYVLNVEKSIPDVNQDVINYVRSCVVEKR